MKTLDKGQDKIRKISDGIRLEVLQPAREEAERIIEEANAKAEAIVKAAEKKAQKLLEDAKVAIDHERNVFHSSLAQSSKQTLEALKQSIEGKLFNEELEAVVAQQTSDPKIVAGLITAIVNAVDREGLSTDISAVIPKGITPQQVNQLLTQEVLKKLKDNSVSVGAFAGGAQIKLEIGRAHV